LAARNTLFAQLVDLVEGRLSAEEADQLRTRIADDTRAASDVAWLERVIGIMRRGALHSEEPPESEVARAVRLFRPAGSAGLAQRLMGVLRFDSLRQPQPLGLRSAAPTERQLLFMAGGLDLEVRIVPAGPLWSVSGQVLGPASGGGRVVLSGPAGTAAAQLSALSEFVLPALPAGSYRLTLQLAGVEIEVSDLDIGS
jgi:anti-sigma factor RsiW